MPSAYSPVIRSSNAAPPRAAVTLAGLDHRLAACVCASDEAHLLLEVSVEARAREIMGAIGEKLLAVMDSDAFEREIRLGPDMAGRRLRRLAVLRVRINVSPLAEHHRAGACAILRRLEERIHADAVEAGSRLPAG